MKDTPVKFPDERNVKIKLYANEKFDQIRKIALMNATNTNRIPQYYRDFYLDKQTKKLLPWVHIFDTNHKNKKLQNIS